MTIIDKVLKNLEVIVPSSNVQQYSLFQETSFESEIFYGKNSENQIVFAMESKDIQLRPTFQKTNKLVFLFNVKCSITIDGKQSERYMNVLVCQSHDKNEKMAFIRLTLAFAEGVTESNSKNLRELFTTLTHLFANEHKTNKNELQGLFGELYAIKYFYDLELNLSKYWQKKDKLKFDFSISEKKKVEVKTTTKETRVHHFKHEQLLSDLYEICVISLMLRENDTGLSLNQIILEVRDIVAGNLDTLIHIENIIKNYDEDELKSIKYDTIVLENNLHIYKAEDIPKFLEEQPKGVSKTEYDSDISTSPT